MRQKKRREEITTVERNISCESEREPLVPLGGSGAKLVLKHKEQKSEVGGGSGSAQGTKGENCRLGGLHWGQATPMGSAKGTARRQEIFFRFFLYVEIVFIFNVRI